MMGRLAGFQEQLFYTFSLEAHVPSDHLLRRVDGVLDLSFLRDAPAPFYSENGRPSIDPELMIGMLLIGMLLRHPLRAAVVRGSASQSRVSLVLPARAGRPGSGSHDVICLAQQRLTT
jgi:hypothetical protein